MSLRPPDSLEPREQARFPASERHAILLVQSTNGIALCDVCNEHIATLSDDGHWIKLRPIAFDHILARGLHGPTERANGRAICDHPRDCHKAKSADDQKRMAKADAQAGRTGQYARRKMRKAAGEKSLIPNRGFK